MVRNLLWVVALAFGLGLPACGGGGGGGSSTPATPTNPAATAPAAPTNVVGTPLTAISVRITWTDMSKDETGFRIMREPAIVGGTSSQIGTVAANVTTFDDSSASASTSYIYSVKSYNSAGSSVSVTSGQVLTPAAPVNGVQWTKISTGLPTATATALAVNGVTMYAGLEVGVGMGSAFYKSTNSGTSWSALPATQYTTNGALSLSVHSVDSLTVYAVTLNNLIKSTDGGANFVPLSILTNRGNVVVDPQFSARAWYGGDNVSRSSTSGASWGNVLSGLTQQYGYGAINVIAIDYLSTNVVYVGTDVDGIYKTIDDGVNWTVLDLKDSFGGYRPVFGLAVDPGNSNVVYAGTDNGIYKSTNEGKTFAFVGLSGKSIGSMIVQRSTGTVFAGSGGTLYESTNGGTTWTTGASIGSVSAFTVDTTPLVNTVFAATSTGVYKTQ